MSYNKYYLFSYSCAKSCKNYDLLGIHPQFRANKKYLFRMNAQLCAILVSY